MSRFKIIVFLMAMGVLAAILATAYWFSSRVIAPDAAAASQVTKMHEKGAPPADPGIKRFDKAAELIQDGDLDGGRSAPYELVPRFPKTTRVSERHAITREI